MDSIVTKKTLKDVLDKKVTRDEAEEAVKTLIKSFQGRAIQVRFFGG